MWPEGHGERYMAVRGFPAGITAGDPGAEAGHVTEKFAVALCVA